MTPLLRSLPSDRLTFRSHWPYGLALLAVGIHSITALLRLDAFFPSIRLIDFASFYAGAWALRLGQPAYDWTPEFRALMTEQTGLVMNVLPNSLPLWLWLMQPFTWLPYPVAAWVWLALNLGLLIWSTHELCNLAGIQGRARRVAVFGVSLVFGPTFLTLTLGQTYILLVVLALWVGKQLRRGTGPAVDVAGSLLWLAALTSKLFPLLWFGALGLVGKQGDWGRTLTVLALLTGLHAVPLSRVTLD